MVGCRVSGLVRGRREGEERREVGEYNLYVSQGGRGRCASINTRVDEEGGRKEGGRKKGGRKERGRKEGGRKKGERKERGREEKGDSWREEEGGRWSEEGGREDEGGSGTGEPQAGCGGVVEISPLAGRSRRPRSELRWLQKRRTETATRRSSITHTTLQASATAVP